MDPGSLGLRQGISRSIPSTSDQDLSRSILVSTLKGRIRYRSSSQGWREAGEAATPPTYRRPRTTPICWPCLPPRNHHLRKDAGPQKRWARCRSPWPERRHPRRH